MLKNGGESEREGGRGVELITNLRRGEREGGLNSEEIDGVMDDKSLMLKSR